MIMLFSTIVRRLEQHRFEQCLLTRVEARSRFENHQNVEDLIGDVEFLRFQDFPLEKYSSHPAVIPIIFLYILHLSLDCLLFLFLLLPRRNFGTLFIRCYGWMITKIARGRPLTYGTSDTPSGITGPRSPWSPWAMAKSWPPISAPKYSLLSLCCSPGPFLAMWSTKWPRSSVLRMIRRSFSEHLN